MDTNVESTTTIITAGTSDAIFSWKIVSKYSPEKVRKHYKLTESIFSSTPASPSSPKFSINVGARSFNPADYHFPHTAQERINMLAYKHLQSFFRHCQPSQSSLDLSFYPPRTQHTLKVALAAFIDLYIVSLLEDEETT